MGTLPTQDGTWITPTWYNFAQLIHHSCCFPPAVCPQRRQTTRASSVVKSNDVLSRRNNYSELSSMLPNPQSYVGRPSENNIPMTTSNFNIASFTRKKWVRDAFAMENLQDPAVVVFGPKLNGHGRVFPAGLGNLDRV
jgi:hypothetical protein